ncbi:hypothetical protein [Streptomyces sp. NPDC007369]|uniref:hypothetical protein n=1 Tax=Streptomyces sp. NPDC007369 TaxID=3154589 RepID=UPI0033FA94E4
MSEYDEPLDVIEPADFDAFFAEQAPGRPRASLTLYGREYVLPDSLPLLFTLQMERVQSSSDPADVRRMLSTLFGEGALDTWAEAGMTDRQLAIVLIYSAANVRRPGSVSMQRAAELHDEQEAAKEGKGTANRAQRRATSKKKRAATARSGARS